MKQVVQNYKTGDLWLEEVPVPICKPGGVVVRTEFSVVSTGTERMKVEQARMSLLAKARARPDKVKQVLQNVQQNGLSATIEKVKERLDELTTLGYSSAGIVEEVGAGIDHLAVGDRVACAGEGIACHSEFVYVPKNLCVKVRDDVSARDAAFATIGAIAMNGVRQSQVALGDVVLVIGLGLVGLIAVQLLRAAGCRVIGVDLAEEKLELAKACGAELAFRTDSEDLEKTVLEMTGNRGVDSTYIAASTSSTGPMDLAGRLSRDRASVVIVGMVPINADWREYYAKELRVLLSRSYGPGRYDPHFENKGVPYPVGYIPWSQNRNLEEFIRLVGDGLVKPDILGSKEFDFADAPEAYREVHESPNKHSLGVVFRYPAEVSHVRKVALDENTAKPSPDRTSSADPGIGLVGAGNFTTGTIIPALKQAGGARFVGVCSAGGLSAKATAKKHGFAYATSELQELLDDADVDAVIIATRHNTHAEFAHQALRAGKHVFVEKPLALTQDDLTRLQTAAVESGKILMPGFNRRFSPLSVACRDHFGANAGPLEVLCRVNAGLIELDSWYQDDEEGGWRIVSEGCHWLDLMCYVTGSAIASVSARMIQGATAGTANDNCIAVLTFANGSIGTLAYLANGDARYPKERIEVFGQQKTAVIENWTQAVLYVNGARKKVHPRGTGKGHSKEFEAFLSAVRNAGESPIELASSLNVSRAALAIQESLNADGRLIALP